MTTSQRAFELIKEFESLRLKAYICPAGKPSIGYGTTRGVKMGMVCTVEQAEKWLKRDVADVEHSIDSLVSVTLTQNQYDALVSFVYNVGAPKFATSTLLKLLNQNRVEEAGKQLLRWKYHLKNGKMEVSSGLIRRRGREYTLFNT